MSRRLTAVMAAAALGVAVLPATAALASAASGAVLTAGSAVYPGADRSFTIRVTNNESPVVGKTIDAIRVNLPVSEAGITLGSNAGSAPGFTATSTNLGGTQFNTYRGGRLAPGLSVDITFPATVAAPLAKDLLGDFRVQVSSDNFATSKTATGNLLTKVQILEIVAGGLKPLAPTNADGTKGVTDRTGTSEQEITYGAEIRNHAQQKVSVLAGISSSAGDTSTPTTVEVPGLSTAVAEIPVQLGQAASDRNTVFTATAEKTDKSAIAPPRTDAFTVQAPAVITYSNLTPTRVKSGPGSATDFKARAAKSGTPAVDALTSTLSFNGNSATTKTPTFPRGASSQDVTYSFSQITGTDGAFPTTVTSAITDDNLAVYGATGTLADVVIDNLAPILTLNVTLPVDRDGDQQVAAKDLDTISVSGTITNAGDYAANSLKVVLTPNAGPEVVVPVTVSGSGDSRSFSGSAKPDWDDAATSFVAQATALDTAGNSGGIGAAASVIDNAVPKMIGSGVIIDPTTISVAFSDATGVAGGCDPKMWLVDGTPGMVTAVKDATGGDCKARDTGARTLTLRNPLRVDDTPRITYDPAGSRVITTLPVKDGAANDALRQTVETISNLVPQPPQLLGVDRRDGSATAAFEPAYQDTEDKGYYTNVSGDDTMRLTVGGIRQNYTLQILRAGSVVASRKFTAAPLPGATSYSGDLTFPVAAGDAATLYTARFVSGVGNTGDGIDLTVVLDTVRPGLGANSISNSVVSLAFSEKVVTGSNFADNWFVSETVQTETGTARRTVNVDSVSAPDLSNRQFEVTLRDATKYAGMDYFVQSGNRYEDRAGNTLADTLKVG